MIDTFKICDSHLQPGEFSTRIASTDSSDFRIFIFTADIYYLSQDGRLFCLPKDGKTDLASIPRPLWALLPPQGENGAEYGLAACGHDFCYKDVLLLWQEPNGWIKATLPKPDCDLLLKEMMLACQVPEDITERIYLGVKFGGQASFDKDRS